MPPVDPAILRATFEIKSLFEDKYHRPRKKALYIGQLQVLLEEKFFPWIVYNATMQLVKDGYLNQHIVQTKYADKVTFLYHHHFTEKEMSTRLANTVRLIEKYSNPDVADALGKHLEGLVKAELRAQNFDIKGIHTNEYEGRKWPNTSHTLDFIAEHKSQRLKIGVEVKNTLSVPEREEIETKIKLCHYLKLTPVFAARWIKPYVNLISQEGGFSWFFKTQIYPLGFERHAKTIWGRLRLPVTVRTELPEKSVQIFNKWVDKQTQLPT